MNINFNLADLIKAPIKIIIAIMLSSGIILFSPEEVVSKLYMVDFRNNYGFFISIVFLITFSISLTAIMANVCGNFRELYLAKKLMKNAKFQKVI